MRNSSARIGAATATSNGSCLAPRRPKRCRTLKCAADGYQSDSKSCAGKVQAYPTWQINGQFYGGMKSLDELARLSGFVEKKPPPALAVDMSSSGKGTVRGDPGCTLSDGEENCEKK